MNTLPIALACDHAGVSAKPLVKQVLSVCGFDVLDLGTDSTESVDYPDYGNVLAGAIKEGKAELGILLCGSGNGIAIAANRHTHIRAAVAHNSTSARYARLHNDANVLALGVRFVGEAVLAEAIEAFLTTAFEGGRHQKRIDKLGG